MIRLFAPPTRDAVVRSKAVTAVNFLVHAGVLFLLLVPLARVAKEQLLDRLVVFLVPPDPVGAREGAEGTAAYAVKPADGGLVTSHERAVGSELQVTTRGAQPTLESGDLQIARPDPGDNAFTVLEVDSAIARDPESAAPEYPLYLLRQGIEGSASVRFVVDSTGLVDTLTYRVVRATHDDFAVAVRRALPFMHFRPAIQGGRRVRQLAEQTFSFRITPRDTLRLQ